MSNQVRCAVIGLGVMGRAHTDSLRGIDAAKLIAVCDAAAPLADAAAEKEGVPGYTDPSLMMDKERPDAVVVATPHTLHAPLAEEAFGRGIHVLCEKPAAVHVNEVKRMSAAWESGKLRNPSLQYALMFQLRALGIWRTVKTMIEEEKLGRLLRTTWIVTSWFRSQRYYDSSPWRATWKGEGGGLLLNQCPHNFDLYQWLAGMPARVTGHCGIGRHHDIEVEDEVTAYFEHDNGMTGHFISSTAELPGTDRLEITGDKGRLVVEKGEISFFENRVPASQVIAESQESLPKPDGSERIVEPVDGLKKGAHKVLMKNFIDAIQTGAPLIAPGAEGINAQMIINGITMSHFTGASVTLPLDGDAYEGLLNKLIAESDKEKK